MSDEIRAILEELDLVVLHTIIDTLEIPTAYEIDRDVICHAIVDHAFDHDLDVDDIREVVQEATFTLGQDHDDTMSEEEVDAMMEEISQ